MKEFIKKYSVLILGILIIVVCGYFAFTSLNKQNNKIDTQISVPIENKEDVNKIKFQSKFVSETEKDSYIGFITKNEIILSLNGESARYKISNFEPQEDETFLARTVADNGESVIGGPTFVYIEKGLTTNYNNKSYDKDIIAFGQASVNIFVKE